ncbi:DUF3533 domain-containing protein [Pediococcus stilesii]|uniref:DUF3533 domain-containing protein n=1 Tax=Pediococcus stilesii TaxID=331679 RepID=A0A5R9BVL4_9LACO|nr:YhgE/Pip family protein [Pediococcus stilesii]TLQ04313.1 DUF3533 domain-containing protein [Pediococcus stilesii]
MFKNEWMAILKKPLMIAVMISIALVPAIYSGVYLSSMWNTYGHEKEIPVAIVNTDKKVSLNGQKIDMGKNLVSGLKKSRSLNYKSTSEQAASDGLKSGKFYMVIKIPDNFSKNMSTLMTKHPEKMKIIYETNRGLNFFAGQVSEGTMKSVKESITSQVTKEYIAAILTQFKTAGKGMQTASEANQAMAKAITSGNGSLDESTLMDEMKNLYDGNIKVSNDLKNGSQRISQLPAEMLTSEALSNPVELVHHDISKTKFNGVGMAPFAICIGLYVGCISISFMYDMYNPKQKPSNALVWWFSKASVLFILSALQSIIAVFTIVNLLGLNAVNIQQTALLIMVISVAFMSCVFALNVLLGAFGKYLVTILLILQLGGSGGVYPIETANRFSKITNPYLPMTYGIHGLKESISIGNGIASDLKVLVAVIVILNIMIILKMATDVKSEKLKLIAMN